MALAVALGLAACGGSSAGSSGDGGSGLSGAVRVDGSSTVAPLSTVAAELFQEANPDVQVTVGTSGTGGGFEKFCNGETDINDASRPIKDEEGCRLRGEGHHLRRSSTIALDALTVVVNKENTWATCLTIEQLGKIWAPDSTIDNWNQVDPSFPDEKLTLFGPGTDSGTFDYFTDEINGEEGASRTDYSPSEDDNVTVQGVEGSKGGLGYFGFTYYEENADKSDRRRDRRRRRLRGAQRRDRPGRHLHPAVPAAVHLPERHGHQAGAGERPSSQYYVDNNAQIAEEGLFIPLNAEQEAELKSTWSTFQAANG